jgi:hypothetical protein
MLDSVKSLDDLRMRQVPSDGRNTAGSVRPSPSKSAPAARSPASPQVTCELVGKAGFGTQVGTGKLHSGIPSVPLERLNHHSFVEGR